MLAWQRRPKQRASLLVYFGKCEHQEHLIYALLAGNDHSCVFDACNPSDRARKLRRSKIAVSPLLTLALEEVSYLEDVEVALGGLARWRGDVQDLAALREIQVGSAGCPQCACPPGSLMQLLCLVIIPLCSLMAQQSHREPYSVTYFLMQVLGPCHRHASPVPQ